jgi:hypothetical protein
VDARYALLGSLIDHAPLFPPASLPVSEALEEDRRARASEHSWLLARFVVPASKLVEVAEDRALSVVVDGEVPDDPRVESIEAREPVEFAGEVYVEGVALGELVRRRLRAKVRCGGDRIPSIAELAGFVRGCRGRGLVFKATAGLHHAYPTESGEHGFLNLLAAAVFGDEERALAAPPGSFELDPDSFRWGDRRAGPAELARVRETLLHSIGSCSFFEPVEELRQLAMLP